MEITNVSSSNKYSQALLSRKTSISFYLFLELLLYAMNRMLSTKKQSILKCFVVLIVVIVNYLCLMDAVWRSISSIDWRWDPHVKLQLTCCMRLLCLEWVLDNGMSMKFGDWILT